MQFLSKIRLSEHKSFDSLGQLICTDCIIARTGPQEYYASELDPNYEGEDKIITIDRTEKEVFSPATIASFENVPFVDEHPDEDVNVNTNFKQLSKGFIRDIHRGMDGTTPVLLANLICNDKDTIEEIQNGKAELSCGYNCDITEGDHPEQINIRGNHVALCQQGRAGNARIIDSQEKGKIKLNKADKPFAVVAEKDFDKNKENCYVEELADTLEDAKYLCRLYNDRKNKNYIVVSCKKGKAEEVEIKDSSVIKHNGYPIFKIGDSFVTKLMFERQTHDSLAEAKNEIDNFIDTSKQMLKDRAIMQKAKDEKGMQKINGNILKQEIRNVLNRLFNGDEEIVNDIVVEISPVPVDNCVKVEVRAEFGYKTMDKIATALNPIVDKYDAYFDHECCGVINAFLPNCELAHLSDSKHIRLTRDSDDYFKIGDYIEITKGTNIDKGYICKIVDMGIVNPKYGTNISGQQWATRNKVQYKVVDSHGNITITYSGNFVRSNREAFINQRRDFETNEYNELKAQADELNGQKVNVIDKNSGRILEKDQYCKAKISEYNVNGVHRYKLKIFIGFWNKEYNLNYYDLEVIK